MIARISIHSLIYYLIFRSCPWRDEGPSKGWGLTEFQLFHGGLWKYGPKEYLWTEKLINKMRALSRYFKEYVKKFYIKTRPEN